MRVVAVAAVVALALAGCTSDSIEAGEVIDKDHRPGWTQQLCQTRVSNGAIGAVTTQCYPVVYPDQWRLKLRSCVLDECETGWVEVDAGTFADTPTGAHYPSVTR